MLSIWFTCVCIQKQWYNNNNYCSIKQLYVYSMHDFKVFFPVVTACHSRLYYVCVLGGVWFSSHQSLKIKLTLNTLGAIQYADIKEPKIYRKNMYTAYRYITMDIIIIVQKHNTRGKSILMLWPFMQVAAFEMLSNFYTIEHHTWQMLTNATCTVWMYSCGSCVGHH